jgi:protocatechuate 3,4-dioxygenase beta subunit
MRRLRRWHARAAGILICVAGGALGLGGLLLDDGGDDLQASGRWGGPDHSGVLPGGPGGSRGAPTDAALDPALAGGTRLADGASGSAAGADGAGEAGGARRDGAAPDGNWWEEGRPEPPRIVMRGTVTDANGNLVAGASIYIQQARGRRGRRGRRGQPQGQGEVQQVETDAGGRFQAELPEGAYVLTAKLDGYAPSRPVGARVDGSEEVELEPLLLEPATALRGVVASSDGLPLPAQVVVRGEDLEREVQAGADGAFLVEDLREGLYRLDVSHDGYVPLRQDDVPVVVERGGQVELALVRSGRLEGLLRLASGEVFADGMLFVYRDGERLAYVHSDEQGRYAVNGLPDTSAGSGLELFVRSEDYGHSARVQGLRLTAGQVTVHDIVLEEGPRITGRLTSADGAPLAGLTVQAYEVNGEVRREGQSQADGTYLVENLYPGTYRLIVPHPDGRMEPRVEETLEVSAGEARRDLVVPTGAVLAGTVSGPDGKPLEGAWVFAVVGQEYRGRTQTAADGTFRVDSLDPDSYQVYVRYGGDQMVGLTLLEVGRDQVIEGLRLEARPPASLTGRVLAQDGMPLEGILIRVQGQDAPVRRSATTDADGVFRIHPLYDGAYELTADDGPLILAAAKLDAKSAKLAPLTFSIEDGRSLERDLEVELTFE